MGSRIERETEPGGACFLSVCPSDSEAILDSADPLRPGFTYLLSFGGHFRRLTVQAFVRYSHIQPGSPRRFEIGLVFPRPEDGLRLAALNRASVDPLPLHGHPKLVSTGEPAAGEGIGSADELGGSPAKPR